MWDSEKNAFIAGHHIFNQLSVKTNRLAEYKIVKRAIPKPWISLLKNFANRINDTSNKFQNEIPLTISHDRILRNASAINPCKLKTKEIYYHCLYPCNPPNCINVWRNVSPQFDWKHVCKMLYNPLQSNKK